MSTSLVANVGLAAVAPILGPCPLPSKCVDKPDGRDAVNPSPTSSARPRCLRAPSRSRAEKQVAILKTFHARLEFGGREGGRRVDSRVVAPQLQLLLLQLLHQILLKYKHSHTYNCTPIKGIEGYFLSSTLCTS